MSAAQATAAVAQGLRRAQPRWDLDCLAAADGGPGTLEALRAARGGRLRQARVSGPTVGPLRAAWLDLGSLAVIESAQAIGLGRLPAGRKDAMGAHSLGLGELLLAVAAAGKREILLGLGGSACTDGGTGMARALGWKFLDEEGCELALGGGALRSLHRIESPRHRALRGLRITALCDVTNPLNGPRGAAAIFSPQKGAGPASVRRLEQGLRRLAAVSKKSGLAQTPGAGAAGGLGFGLLAFAGARLQPGAERLLDLAGLEARLRAADLVLTGEGRLDVQSLGGKLPAVVAARAAQAGKPCVAVCGSNALQTASLKDQGWVQALPAPGRGLGAAPALRRAVERWARGA